MNDYEPRESVAAFKAFMRAVQRDLALGQGAIKPATVKWADRDERQFPRQKRIIQLLARKIA